MTLSARDSAGGFFARIRLNEDFRGYAQARVKLADHADGERPLVV